MEEEGGVWREVDVDVDFSSLHLLVLEAEREGRTGLTEVSDRRSHPDSECEPNNPFACFESGLFCFLYTLTVFFAVGSFFCLFTRSPYCVIISYLLVAFIVSSMYTYCSLYAILTIQTHEFHLLTVYLSQFLVSSHLISFHRHYSAYLCFVFNLAPKVMR